MVTPVSSSHTSRGQYELVIRAADDGNLLISFYLCNYLVACEGARVLAIECHTGIKLNYIYILFN